MRSSIFGPIWLFILLHASIHLVNANVTGRQAFANSRGHQEEKQGQPEQNHVNHFRGETRYKRVAQMGPKQVTTKMGELTANFIPITQ